MFAQAIYHIHIEKSLGELKSTIASKFGVFRSFLDGLGMGVGFTLSLMALAAVRELFGTGFLTFWVTPIRIFGPSYQPFSFLVEAPGAFMALGLMLCLMNLVGKK